jgi:hypothetical protein
MVIVLDGPGAAGSSTLAADLGLLLAASVVEGDDFYRDMPEEQYWSLTTAQGVVEYAVGSGCGTRSWNCCAPAALRGTTHSVGVPEVAWTTGW